MPKGYVDFLSYKEVTGWLASEGDEAAFVRYVRIVVDGTEIGTIRADLYRHDLVIAGVSNGFSGFRFVFPNTPNPAFDHVVELTDRDTGVSLIHSPWKLPSLVGNNEGQHSYLQFDREVATTHLRAAVFQDGTWRINFELFGPRSMEFWPEVRNGEIKEINMRVEKDAFLDQLKVERKIVDCSVRAAGPGIVLLEPVKCPRRMKKYLPVCKIALPAKIPDYIREIEQENMTRVSGPLVTRDLFVASGFHTAFRIDSLLQAHFGRGIAEFRRVLDWGVGASRVALPYKQLLAPQTEFAGIDVDPVNVSLGRERFSCISYDLAPYYPPTNFPSGSFDAVYGISVVTHLTEGAQFVWLKELRRLVKEGAPIVLTVHGDYSILDVAARAPEILDGACVRGFHDQTLDMNLGPKLPNETYYRATFHTREYVEENWTEYFDIVGYYPGANGIIQDFIVLRAK